MNTPDLQKLVNDTFTNAFGRTPYVERIEDIVSEIDELSRATDDANIDEELGDSLASLIQLANERNKNIEDLITKVCDKIRSDQRQKTYSSLGRKKRVLIFGGAFDPIHKGHIEMIRIALDYGKFDEAWITPAYKHMYNKPMTDFAHRMNMCHIAAAVDRRIQVFDYEIRNKLAGDTYHLVKRLQEEDFAKNYYKFYFLIGLDNANTFHKWVNYETLERLIPFVVVARSGAEINPKVTWYMRRPHHFIYNEPVNCSSTDVRQLLEDGKTEEAACLLDPKVLDYIVEHELYTKKEAVA